MVLVRLRLQATMPGAQSPTLAVVDQRVVQVVVQAAVQAVVQPGVVHPLMVQAEKVLAVVRTAVLMRVAHPHRVPHLLRVIRLQPLHPPHRNPLLNCEQTPRQRPLSAPRTVQPQTQSLMNQHAFL